MTDKETAAALESIRAMNAQILTDLDTMKTAADDSAIQDIEEIRKRQIELLIDLEVIVKND